MSGAREGCEICHAEADGFVVEFDSSVYSLSAIKKAAYKFGRDCHVLVESQGSNHIRVLLRAKRVLDNSKYLAGEFCNAVLDEDLREKISQETEGIRNLMMAQAFSKTTLLDEEFETADYADDPANNGRSDSQ